MPYIDPMLNAADNRQPPDPPDIVERLRAEGADAMRKYLSLGMFNLCAEAADEIEHLRRMILSALDCLGNDDPKGAYRALTADDHN